MTTQTQAALTTEVFPMMQADKGYWWAVYDQDGHIRKLGRADTRDEADRAAYAWVRAVVNSDHVAREE